MTPLRRILALALIIAAPYAPSAVRILNDEPRRDIDGRLMDIHDGNIMQWTPGGPYFWYGMGYGDCPLRQGWLPPRDCPGIYEPVSQSPCGFRLDHAIHVYSSPNLVDWRWLGEALPVARQTSDGVVERPEGVYFRPKVVFNALTRRYVLWVNRLPASQDNKTIPLLAYPRAMYVVATSARPEGPFTVVTPEATIAHSGAGDFDVLVTGSEAFLAYTSWHTDHRVVVQALNPTFTDCTGPPTSPVTALSHEAPVLMQRAGWFYLLSGETCCFCRPGSGARVSVSPHPLGPWMDTGVDIARPPGSNNRSVSHSQQSFVFAAATSPLLPTWVWAGDQWGSSPDGLKSHDLQYWAPMEWDDDAQPPLPKELRLLDSFELALGRRGRK